MNKADLIDKVAGVTCTKAEAERAVNAFMDGIKGALAKGERVLLVGLGSFDVRERAARAGRNPQTGATIRIPGKKVPVFKAGKALKDAVL